MGEQRIWTRFWLWAIIVLVAIGLISFSFWDIHHTQPNKSTAASGQHHNPPAKGQSGSSSSTGKGTSSGSSNNSGKGNSNSPKLAWGFDTTSTVNSSFYQCVASSYGKPVFVARYLDSKQGVYTGLTKSEVSFLHTKNVKILPIYDLNANATGSQQGTTHAKQAIKLANSLGMDKGTYITVDVEKGITIDSNFLISWTKTLENAGYKPGLYGDLTSSSLITAYNQASKQNQSVKNDLIIWTNQPIIGIKGKSNVPSSFKGASPNQNQTLVWQYGISNQPKSKCNIDTDLAKGTILKNLW